MDIKSVFENEGGEVVTVTKNDGVEISVPKDERNRYYKMVLEWAADGGVISPADPVPIPTAKQKRRADPNFPDVQSFMEAVLDSKSTKLDAMKAKFSRIKTRNAQMPVN